MNNFLPESYEMTETERRFMEFEEGQNSFRILSSAIVGYEWWVDKGEGGRKPLRVKTAEEEILYSTFPAELNGTREWSRLIPISKPSLHA